MNIERWHALKMQYDAEYAAAYNAECVSEALAAASSSVQSGGVPPTELSANTVELTRYTWARMEKQAAELRVGYAEAVIPALCDTVSALRERVGALEADAKALRAGFIEITDAQVDAVCRRLGPTDDVPRGAMKYALGAINIWTEPLPDGTTAGTRRVARDDLSQSLRITWEKCRDAAARSASSTPSEGNPT